MKSDKEIIQELGGASKVAELLGFKKSGGTQRVHNWMTRGIPASVKVMFPQFFMRDWGKQYAEKS